MPTTALCTREDVNFVLSEFGVSARIDDSVDEDEETSIADRVIRRASNKVIGWLTPRGYTQAMLAGNDFIADAVSVIAAKLFCQRRNESASESLEEQYQELVEFVRKCGSPTSGNVIPGVTRNARAQHEAPGVQNFVWDGRFRSAKIRRQRGISNTPQTILKKFEEDETGLSYEYNE